MRSSSAARLEADLSRLTTALGCRGVFRSTPTELLFAFEEEENAWQRTHFAARRGSGLELNRLADVAAGEQQFLQMFVVALTLAGGLLIGNTIVRAKATS